ncbi:MAG: carbon-nitrogen hydrolase family protein [Boseongicola sp.]|nr:carbon-nitrogen hydrolase family protein [Boseongicola sp.]
MRVGLIQLSASDDPEANLPNTNSLIEKAVSKGADFVLTPEVTNCVSMSRSHQSNVLQREGDDITLAGLQQTAEKHGIYLLIGSLALKDEASDGRFINRSFLLDPTGRIKARYDKIHMFDVSISESETYRESDGYRPGNTAMLANIDGVGLGMTICYDLRFPHLFRDLAKAGAKILTVPSAFSPETGIAHWETLLRARAIETGSYVLAPAQCGTHQASIGRARKTYGRSLAIDPWGRVLADGGDLPGVTMVDLDPSSVDDVRARLPSLTHDRPYRSVT